MIKHNFLQILIALDQLLYCIIGFVLGVFNRKIEVYADMTISAQAYRLASKGYTYGKCLQAFINLIFWNKNHCKEAYESELNRSHLPDDISSK